MKLKRTILFIRQYLCVLVTSIGIGVSFSCSATEVILNEFSVQYVKPSDNLSAIFTLQRRYWVNGEKIHVFVLSDESPLHKRFVKEKLHLFPYQIRRIWNRQIYTGTGQPPFTVSSVAEMIEKVKHTKNAIGYINTREGVDENALYFFNAQ